MDAIEAAALGIVNSIRASYGEQPCEFTQMSPMERELYTRHARAAIAAYLAETGVERDAEPAWQEGCPPKWFDEWFIARTTHGDRVVLCRLPEEYAYDYRTADATYYKAETITRWMQFPESQFLFPGEEPDSARGGEHG